MNLFLFIYWMPEVLHLTGMTPAGAARATSFRELGGIFAVLYLGVSIDRFGPERSLAVNYAAGIVFIALIALVAMSYLPLVIVIFFSGLTIIGSQTSANAACGKLYPARMRTSGLGWALGIGRLGGIAAPVLGGFLLARGLPPRQIFLSACGFAFVAAVATGLLALRGTHTEVPADGPKKQPLPDQRHLGQMASTPSPRIRSVQEIDCFSPLRGVVSNQYFMVATACGQKRRPDRMGARTGFVRATPKLTRDWA